MHLLSVCLLSLSSLFLLSRTRGISHSLPRIWPRSAKSCAYYSSSSLFLSLSLSLSHSLLLVVPLQRTCLVLSHSRARALHPMNFARGRRAGRVEEGRGGPMIRRDSSLAAQRERERQRERVCHRIYMLPRAREKPARLDTAFLHSARALFLRRTRQIINSPTRGRERSARELSCLLPTLYWSRISRYGTIKGCASGCLQGRYPRSGPLRSLDTKQSATKGKRERGKNRTGE